MFNLQDAVEILMELATTFAPLKEINPDHDIQILERENQIYLVISCANLTAQQAQQLNDALKTALKEKFADKAFQVVISAPKAPASNAPQRQQKKPDGVKHVIAVASGKGGVGKSTLSALLALDLANSGLKVGLLDADIYGPSVPTMFGITNHKLESAGEKQILPVQMGNLSLMSIGLMMDKNQALVWRGPMIISALKQMLYDVVWPQCDVLVVDLPPGTGDAQLTLAQSCPLDGVVIVTTPQELALADARRAIAMFEKLSVPILGVVENMSTYICPNCEHQHPFLSGAGFKDFMQDFKIKQLAQLPFSPQVQKDFDEGKPIQAYNEFSKLCADLNKCTNTIQSILSI